MPADAPAEYAPAMITACSQGLSAGSCALAKETPESETPEAVALVIWQGTQFLQVTVRVARHGNQWTTRKLTFTARDRLLDRWTTVGLTVATLVGEGRQGVERPGNDGPAVETQATNGPATKGQGPGSEGQEGIAGQAANAGPPSSTNEPRAASALRHDPAAPQAPKVPAPPTVPKPMREQAQTAESKVRVEIALGGLLGSGWQNGELSRGIWAGALLGLIGTPFVAEGFASYALSDGPRFQPSAELRSKWSSVALGVGLAGTLRPVDTRVACLVEAMFRHVDAELAGRRASDNELPLRLRGLAAWPSRSRLAALMGAAVQAPFSQTRSSSGSAVRQDQLVGEIQAGVEFRF